MKNSISKPQSKILNYPLSTIKNLENFKVVEEKRYRFTILQILENGDTKIVKRKYFDKKSEGTVEVTKYNFPPIGFKIEKVLGYGTIGVVLLLKEIKTKKLVAYKIGDIDFVLDEGFLQVISLRKTEKDIHVPKLLGITPDGFLMEYLQNYYTIKDYLKLLETNNINQNQISIPEKFKKKIKEKFVSHGMSFSLYINSDYVSKYKKIVETLVYYAANINDEINKKYGIRHQDLHFENVMIKTSRDFKEIKSIKIIDWGDTTDRAYKNEQKRLKPLQKMTSYKDLTKYVNKIKNKTKKD